MTALASKSPLSPAPAPDGATWVAVSGGVDSAVALLRLVREGVPVRALFMKNWEEDDREGYCAAAADLADARAVCDRLGVALDTANFAHEYWEGVFETFLAGSRAGLTPNPDVLCNQVVKFEACLEHALERGGGWFATGHYARTECRDGSTRLLAGRDPDKDQSYFLCRVPGHRLARVRFPLGDMRKTEVRDVARAAGLEVASKRDSTGLCFVGERPFRAFLARFLAPRPGPIRTLDGACIGHHQGIHLYTIGQRSGLGIGGRRGATGAAWYVSGKDVDTDTLWVVPGRDHPALLSRTLLADDFRFVGPAPGPAPRRVQARIRHRQPTRPGTLEPLAQGRWRVCFDRPEWGVTPGQVVAVYEGAECLGGGIIRETSP